MWPSHGINQHVSRSTLPDGAKPLHEHMLTYHQCGSVAPTLVSIQFWKSWWRHQMEIYSVLQAFCAGNSPVTGELPAQRPVTRSFDAFFDLHLNKRLSTQSRRWWFGTPPRSLSHRCNGVWKTLVKWRPRLKSLMQSSEVWIRIFQDCCPDDDTIISFTQMRKFRPNYNTI